MRYVIMGLALAGAVGVAAGGWHLWKERQRRADMKSVYDDAIAEMRVGYAQTRGQSPAMFACVYAELGVRLATKFEQESERKRWAELRLADCGTSAPFGGDSVTFAEDLARAAQPTPARR